MHSRARRRPVDRPLLAAVAVIVFSACQAPNDPVDARTGALTTSVQAAPVVGAKAKIRIKSLSLSTTTLIVAGLSSSYTVTLQNSGADAANLALRGEVVQGAANRVTGDTNNVCGSGSGVAPKGSCSTSNPISVSNVTAGSGWLAGGSAIFRLTLLQFDPTAPRGTPPTILDVREVAVTLVGILFTSISDLTNDTLRINQDSILFSITFNNSTGIAQDSVFVLTFVDQGSVTKLESFRDADCGGAPRQVPVGPCTMGMVAKAFSSGADSLTIGPAVFRVDIVQKAGVVRDRRTFPVFLLKFGTPLGAGPARPGHGFNQ